MLETILTALIASAGANGIFVFIFKKWIEHTYAKELAAHTATLSRDNELEIASFKHKLELASAERGFRFSHIFEHTAETIASVYEKLVAFKNAVDAYTIFFEGSGEEQKAKLAKKLDETREDFLTYFEKSKIYIPKATSKTIVEFSETLMQMQLKYRSVIMMERANVKPDVVVSHFNEFDNLSRRVRELLGLLEDDFQKVLGFPMGDKSGV